MAHSLGPTFTKLAGPVLRSLLKIAGDALDPLERLVRDEPGYPGWSLAGDLDKTPSLAWLLQWVGVTYRDELSSSSNRDSGRLRPEMQRGTPGHFMAVAREHLSGAKKVEIYERYGGNKRAVLVRVYAAELVGTQTSLETALRRTKPWTIQLAVEVVTGWSYDQARTAYPTYAGKLAALPTYNDTTYHQP